MGHEFRGRETDTGEAYVRSTEADGTAKVSVGSSSLSGLSKVDGDFLCTLWDVDIETTCAVIFRNSGGAREKQNEYLLMTARQRIEVSVIEWR
jgi:hypothetical protein